MRLLRTRASIRDGFSWQDCTRFGFSGQPDRMDSWMGMGRGQAYVHVSYTLKTNNMGRHVQFYRDSRKKAFDPEHVRQFGTDPCGCPHGVVQAESLTTW